MAIRKKNFATYQKGQLWNINLTVLKLHVYKKSLRKIKKNNLIKGKMGLISELEDNFAQMSLLTKLISKVNALLSIFCNDYNWSCNPKMHAVMQKVNYSQGNISLFLLGYNLHIPKHTNFRGQIGKSLICVIYHILNLFYNIRNILSQP